MSEDSETPRRGPSVLGVDAHDRVTVLRLGGELDLYNADEVRSALARLIETAPTKVVVDLSEVEFIDSTALGVLIEARSRLGREGLHLAGPQIATRRTLQVSGIDRHLPVHDTVDDALASD